MAAFWSPLRGLTQSVTAIEAANEGKSKQTATTGAILPESGQRLDKHRQLLLAVTQRSALQGRGASATRLHIATSKDAPAPPAVTKAFIAVPESVLNTDTSPAYTELGTRFRAHRTVEHSRTLIGPNGEHNNHVESFAWRVKRGEKGIPDVQLGRLDEPAEPIGVPQRQLFQQERARQRRDVVADRRAAQLERRRQIGDAQQPRQYVERSDAGQVANVALHECVEIVRVPARSTAPGGAGQRCRVADDDDALGKLACQALPAPDLETLVEQPIQ
jgi:hypothetical protein